MKVLVVYESMFGNTEEVARAVAEGMRPVAEVDLVEVDEAPVEPGPDVDLVVAGGPTHAFSMSRESTREDAARQGGRTRAIGTGLRDWVAALPAGRHPQRLVTFDTRVGKVRHLPGSAAKAAARAARRHGYAAGEPESFWVQDISGPLLEGELDRARAWGRHLVEEAHQPAR
jgi:hypothetical protein